jgi:hypothetical protein
MRIVNIINPERFFSVLNQCEGDVFLLTSEGDRLNLKSRLCQYLALSKMFSDAKIDELDIQLSNPGDIGLLLDYLVEG